MIDIEIKLIKIWNIFNIISVMAYVKKMLSKGISSQMNALQKKRCYHGIFR